MERQKFFFRCSLNRKKRTNHETERVTPLAVLSPFSLSSSSSPSSSSCFFSRRCEKSLEGSTEEEEEEGSFLFPSNWISPPPRRRLEVPVSSCSCIASPPSSTPFPSPHSVSSFSPSLSLSPSSRFISYHSSSLHCGSSRLSLSSSSFRPCRFLSPSSSSLLYDAPARDETPSSFSPFKPLPPLQALHAYPFLTSYKHHSHSSVEVRSFPFLSPSSSLAPLFLLPFSSLRLPSPSFLSRFSASLSTLAPSSFSASSPSSSRPSSCNQLVESIPHLTSKSIAPIASRLVKEGVLDISVWRMVSNRVLEIYTEMNAQEISMLLKAYASRQLRDFTVFARLSSRLLELAKQQKSMLGIHKKKGKKQDDNDGEEEEENEEKNGLQTVPLSPFSSSSSSSERLFRGVDVVNIFVSCGKLLFVDRELHGILREELLNPSVLSELRPKDLVNVAHAYGKLRIRDEEFFRLVAKALPPYLYDLTPMAIANLCTAFANTSLYEEKLFDSLIQEMERRVNEFGGTELLNLLLALSRMQVQLPPDKQRKDRKCWGSILKALRRRMAAFGFIQNLQILECVILLNYYDSIFIHTKLLPSLLAKKPSFSSSSSPASQLSFHQGPAGAGTSRGTAEGILSLYLRLLRCLVRLPSLSQTAVQLLQEVVEVLPGTFINGSQGVPAIAEAIHLLHKLECYDYDCFSKAEAILLTNRTATLRQLRFVNILQLREAYKGFGDDRHWEELLTFLDDLIRETQAMLLKQQAKDMKSAENRLNERTDCERGPPLRGRVEPREEPKEEEEEKSLSRSSLRGVLTGEDKGRENEETFEREISSSSLSLSASLPQRSSITERCGDRRNHLSLAATKDEKNAMEDRKASSVIDRVEEKKSKKKVALVHVHQYTVEDGYSTQPVVLNKHVTNTMT